MNRGGSTSQGLRPDEDKKVLSLGAKFALIFICLGTLAGELLIYNAFYIIAAPYSKLTYNFVIILKRCLARNPLLGLIFIAVAVIVTVVMSRTLRKESRKDPRGFNIAKEQTEGSNHLMKLSEMEETFEMRPYFDPKNIVVGYNKELDELLTIPVTGPKAPATRNMLVVGTSGSRKTSGVLLGMIYSLIQQGSSIVVTDPKGEIYSETIAAAKAYGYNVKIFNIIGRQFQYSDGWDVLKQVREAEDPQVETDLIVNVMIKNIGVFEDDFWNQANTNLLKLAILTVAIGKEYIPSGRKDNAAEGRTMDEVYRLISSPKMKDTIEPLLKYDYNKKYLQTPYDAWVNNTQAEQIRSGLSTKFSILQTERLTRILSEDEINFKDFNDKKTILYLMCSDRDTTYRSVLALFVNSLFKQMSDIADDLPTKTLAIPLYVILEEARNIGYIPDLSVFIATIRSRNISICMCYQNMSQLQDTYSVMRDGRFEWETIKDNCSIQVCCGADGSDKVTCEHFSNKSGQMTIEEITSTKQVSSYVPKGMKFNPREAERKQGKGRAVLLPSEIKDIKKNEILIFKENSNPVIENKYFYKDHPLYDFRVKDENGNPKISELHTHFTYIPEWRRRDMKTDYLKETGEIKEFPAEEISVVRVKDLHKKRRLDEELSRSEQRRPSLVSRIKDTVLEKESAITAVYPVQESGYTSLVNDAFKQNEHFTYEEAKAAPQHQDASDMLKKMMHEDASEGEQSQQVKPKPQPKPARAYNPPEEDDPFGDELY